MEEIYKPIPSLKGYFEVSNLGNIRQIERWDLSRPNGGIKHIKAKQIKLRRGLSDHLECNITIGWRKSKNLAVKNLVAECFVNNPEGHKFVSIINGDKTDLRAENLMYVDYQGAILNAYRNGNKKPFTIFKGNKNPNAKLDEKDIETIKKMRENGLNYTQIAAKFPVKSKQISLIVRGKSWS